MLHTTEDKEVIRTEYMQHLMTSTYSSILIETLNGGFDGAWQRCIAKQLQKDCRNNHSQALEIVDSVGNDLMKAAYLITSSKIKEHVNNQ